MTSTVQKLFAFVLTLTSTVAFAGPESGGGGNVCATPGLVYGTNLKALDIAQQAKVNHSVRLAFLRSQRIRFTAAQAKAGLKVVTLLPSTKKGLSLVLTDLENAGAGQAARELQQSIHDLQITAVPSLPVKKAIGADFREFTKQECSPSNTRAAIYYNWKLGIVLDAGIWNSLATVDQVTLLIHEGLRNLQIRYRQGFSDHLLQLMTKHLMSGNVSSFLSLYKHVRDVKPVGIKGGLCSRENLTVAQKISLSAKASSTAKPLAQLLAKACSSSDARDLWLVMAAVIGQPGSRYGWMEWDVYQADYEGFIHDLTVAYQGTAGLATQKENADELFIDIEDVYNLRGSMWFTDSTHSIDQAKLFSEKLATLMKAAQ